MPDQQLINLLLEEFRAFRDVEFREFKDDVAEWRQDSAARLAVLETSVKSGITGNGQPSRLAVVEKRVDDLEDVRTDERVPTLEADVQALQHVKWYASGIAVAAIALIEFAVKFIPEFFRKQ